jgi:poly(A) polymerase
LKTDARLRRAFLLPGRGRGSNLVLIMEAELNKLMANPAIRTVTALAADLGVDAFLAGGCLRDLLLGRMANDFDFALGGAWTEFPRRFATETGGSFFWLDEERLQARVVRKGEGGTLVYDFAPLRGAAIEEDLARRDFTINALALPLAGGAECLVDPLHGLADLRGGVVRACCEDAFDDDPLRMLRAVRFAAELGFVIEEETWNAMGRKAPLLERVAAERVRDELFRILVSPGVAASLRQLWLAGLWPVLAPAGVPCGIGTAARGKVSPAVEQRMEDAEGVERGSARLADLFPEEKGRLTEYLDGGVEGGISMLALMKLAAFTGLGEREGALALAARLRLGKRAGRLLELLCTDERALFGILERGPSERARYRFFRDREPAGLAMVIVAAASGAIPESCCADLAAYYLHGFEAAESDLFLGGREVMAILGSGPGEAVGEAMARLREAESSGLVNSREEAREFVKNLLTREGPLR